MTQKEPILILGLPRSGTTWVGEVLSSSARTNEYLFEPDNEKLNPIAWVCKRRLHRFPYLTTTDEAPDYYALWNTVVQGMGIRWQANRGLGLFLKMRVDRMETYAGEKNGLVYIDGSMHRVGGGRRDAYTVEQHSTMAALSRGLLSSPPVIDEKKQVIIKSVHACLSGEWIAKHFPVRIMFVLRNPYSLYASYRRLRMPDGYRNLFAQETMQRDWAQFLPGPGRFPIVEAEENIACQIMLMYKVIESQIRAHPEWTLISHDRLCLAPQKGYHQLFDAFGLGWSDAIEQTIDALNDSGKGFTPKRIASQQPTQWKREIKNAEQAIIQRWMDHFELKAFFQEYVNID